MSQRGGAGRRGGARGTARPSDGSVASSLTPVRFPAGSGSASASSEHHTSMGRGSGRGRGNAPLASLTSASKIAPTSGIGSSSSTTELIRDVNQKLFVTDFTPASTKARRIPPRPGYGTIGTKCLVRANHFLVEIQDRDLHHYDVSITPEVTSKKVNRDVMKKLVEMYKESHLGGKTPAYDGSKSIFTAGPLPFESKEFIVILDPKVEGGVAGSSTKSSAAASAGKKEGKDKRERKFKVAIKFAAKDDIHHLMEFLGSRQMDAPHQTIQALDVVLRATPSERYTVVGRSFFSPDLGGKGPLGDGIEYWKGYYQSLRPTQMGLSLNIDVSARSFYEPIMVTQFAAKFLNIRGELSRPLNDQHRIKLKKALKGLRVKLLNGKFTKSYKITGLTAVPLGQLKFSLEGNEAETKVVQYFHDKYNITLRQTFLPALQAGSDTRPAYLPMELCQIVEGQRYVKKLNERQVTALLKATCERPHVREASISKIVKHNNLNDISLVSNEFGMNMKDDFVVVDARILPPPSLKYRESNINPNMGAWNMINKKMVNGARVATWTCLNFASKLDHDTALQFCKQLIDMCINKGMQFNPQPVLPIQSASPNNIEKVLVDLHKQCDGKPLQLLIIILPDEKGSYGTIKRICETELGFISQCCQPRQAWEMKPQYLENVALKINVKAGGRNSFLNTRLPLVSDQPTIIFGADVTHPQPGEDSSPSIAAVVASMDWPEVTKYKGLISGQAHRQEIIENLYSATADANGKIVKHEGMVRDLLMSFKKSTNRKPEKIIFYRDGVSEGQFSQVLLLEMDAIRRACASLEDGYMPPVTFIVVQKRHHTRLFPYDYQKRNLMDKSGNIMPGTVVDTKICHPTEFDFYLNSHAGIQGTSRPAHYHVLFDENGFTSDELQTLTNNLCYTYVRCTRSVSIVPPAYYAHLAAFRAKYYIEDDGSSSAGGSSRTAVGAGSTIPSIKDNVKEVMFYC